MTRIIIAVSVLLIIAPIVGYCDISINPCKITAVPDEIGPNDKIVLLAQGSCSDRYITFSVFRVEESEVGNAVEFTWRYQPVMSLGNSFVSKRPKRPFAILVIEPARPWKVDAKYRIEVHGKRRKTSDSLLLTSDEWHLVNPDKGVPGFGYFVPSAFADCSIAERKAITISQVSPRLTGHTIAKNEYPFPSYQIKLCAEGDPEISKYPDRFLYIVELESSTGEWIRVSVWKPEDYGDRNPLCAYVVGPETIPEKEEFEPGEFRFRLRLISTDGREWVGETRSVEPPAKVPRKN